MAAQDIEVASVPGSDLAAPPETLSPRSRRARLLASATIAGLILAGSIAGHDDKFPFGPFTMYSGYFPPNGVIISTTLTAQTADGRTVIVTQGDTGIPRGDIEGELGAYQADPGRLGDLAAAYHRRHPLAPAFIGMEIVEKRWQLHNRVVVSQRVVTLVSWHAG